MTVSSLHSPSSPSGEPAQLRQVQDIDACNNRCPLYTPAPEAAQLAADQARSERWRRETPPFDRSVKVRRCAQTLQLSVKELARALCSDCTDRTQNRDHDFLCDGTGRFNVASLVVTTVLVHLQQ